MDDTTGPEAFELLKLLGLTLMCGAAIAMAVTTSGQLYFGQSVTESTAWALGISALAAIGIPCVIYTVASWAYEPKPAADLEVESE